MSQQDFDKAIIAERAWELTFENKYWFDLVRKEVIVEVNKRAILMESLEQNSGY